MCRSAYSNQAQLRAPGQSAGADGGTAMSLSPRMPPQRPDAPTPEQTNYWLRDLEGQGPDRFLEKSDLVGRADAAGCLSGDCSESPRERRASGLRPRSPTPTKMMSAWEEFESQTVSDDRDAACRASDSDHEGRGDHTDGLISKLTEACQRNNVQRALALHENLRRMRVPLYEGVYKLLIECCMRTRELGHAMQCYEILKGSGQRVSPRLVMVLMEACAREQFGEKVLAIWNDWCPAGPISSGSCEVLLAAVSALVRTLSPELARDVLEAAVCRWGESFLSPHETAEVDLEELLSLSEEVSDEAQENGGLADELARGLAELRKVLQKLYQRCQQDAALRPARAPGRCEDLLMEDVD